MCLPAIPADAGKDFGIYDTPHSYAGGTELSEHLSREGAKQRDTAGRGKKHAATWSPT